MTALTRNLPGIIKAMTRAARNEIRRPMDSRRLLVQSHGHCPSTERHRASLTPHAILPKDFIRVVFGRTCLPTQGAFWNAWWEASASSRLPPNNVLPEDKLCLTPARSGYQYARIATSPSCGSPSEEVIGGHIAATGMTKRKETEPWRPGKRHRPRRAGRTEP